MITGHAIPHPLLDGIHPCESFRDILNLRYTIVFKFLQQLRRDFIKLADMMLRLISMTVAIEGANIRIGTLPAGFDRRRFRLPEGFPHFFKLADNRRLKLFGLPGDIIDGKELLQFVFAPTVNVLVIDMAETGPPHFDAGTFKHIELHRHIEEMLFSGAGS